MSSESLLGARAVRELLEEHDIRPRKSLGQNFVIDPNTIRKIVTLAQVSADDVVLEVGAGAGSLTLALAAVADRVVALEKDPDLIPVLEQVLGERDNVDVVRSDALEQDLSGLEATRMVANLPYNVAATVVLRTLETAPRIVDLTVMTQREVGDRLAAGVGSKAYGLTSVLVAYFAEARVVGRVSRRAFWPEPNVDSVILKVVRRPIPRFRPRSSSPSCGRLSRSAGRCFGVLFGGSSAIPSNSKARSRRRGSNRPSEPRIWTFTASCRWRNNCARTS